MPSKTEEKNVKTLPNNLEAEQSVLGSAMIDNEAAIEIVSKLAPEDFYSESHQTIFEAMQSLYAKNTPIDIITLSDELDKKEKLSSVGGMSYLTTLGSIVPSAAYHAHYSEIIKRDSVLRQLISACNKITQHAYEETASDEALGFAEKAIYEIAEKGQVSSLEKIQKSLEIVMDKFENIHKNGGNVQGVKTGFYALDQILNGGFNKGDLVIIAARPAVGKTSLAMNIVSNAALEYKAKCAVFSLEMSHDQLTQRMLCSIANVDMKKALRGELTEADWTKLWKANKRLQDANIFIDDSSLNRPSQILSKCRKLKREKGLDLIMIDYLQLMSSDVKKSDNRQTEISDISRRMKILAKEIGVPVVVLSQLSRAVEQRTGKKPVLSDLRESGAIEQDADIVMFIHKEPPENAGEQEDKAADYTAEIILAKHRAGECGSVFLGWKGSRVSFVNLPRDAEAKSLVETYIEPPIPDAPPDIEEVFMTDDVKQIFNTDIEE